MFQFSSQRLSGYGVRLDAALLLLVGLDGAAALDGLVDGDGVKDVDLGGGELPRADPAFEQQVQLGEGAAGGLGDPEVGVDDAQEADAGPEEAGVVFPVPLPRVQHVGGQDGTDDADDVVEVPAQDHGLDLEAAGGELGHQGITDGPHGELVTQRPDQHDGPRGEGGLFPVGLGDDAQEPEDQEHGKEAAEAPEVQGPSPDAARHEEPGPKHPRHVDAVLAQGEVVRRRRVEAGLLEEVGRVSGKGIAGKVLDGPDHADDLGPSEVHSLEAVQVRRAARDFLLERRRVHHHGDRLVGVKVGLAVERSQTEQGLLRVVDPSLSYEPPGTLGGQQDPDEQRYRPPYNKNQCHWDRRYRGKKRVGVTKKEKKRGKHLHPLKSIWNSV